MNVIITGASGMIGKGVLLECLENTNIQKVLVIGRSPLGIEHEKLEEIIRKDFSQYDDIKDKLSGFGACFLCMGISAAGLSEEEYHQVTYEYTLALAKVLRKLNSEMTCIYVSGVGTDSTEKGSIMWARVKGKTENELMKLDFKKAYMFRPGAIIPKKGITSRTKSYRLLYKYFMWLVHLIKFFAPKSVVDTTQIGNAMIYLAFSSYDKTIITPKDILSIANKDQNK